MRSLAGEKKIMTSEPAPSTHVSITKVSLIAGSGGSAVTTNFPKDDGENAAAIP